MNTEVLLELESRKCFEYLWREANTDIESPGYGLVRDRAPSNPHVSSIAAVGFALSALPIGVKRGWVSFEEAYLRAAGTLDTFLHNAEGEKGFFYHFLHPDTGKRIWKCEISVIDTAILLCGAVTAAEFFGDKIREKAYRLYERMDWPWFFDQNSRLFRLGYKPETGFFGYWDSYAEQLMIYFFACASPKKVDGSALYSFERYIDGYGPVLPFIYSYTGALFTYQFTHAWFDLRSLYDQEGVNWFENSVRASQAAWQYAVDFKHVFKTFGKDSWGLTACDGPKGYGTLYGSPPRKTEDVHFGNDGTVPPCGAIGSIVFTPKESIAALHRYYRQENLIGPYGLQDAYNLDLNWTAKDVIGIDKGISLLMMENYRSGLVWDLFMKNEFVQKGIKEAGLVKKKTTVPVSSLYRAQ
jgi:hypothetical protein